MKLDYKKILCRIYSLIKKLILWCYARWDAFAVCGLCFCLLMGMQWYTYRYTPSEENAVRSHVVQVAQQYLGYNEADGSHRQIIDRYNAHEPRARDYEVTYEDSWCAVYVSTVALDALVDNWIPLECGCEQQILLFDERGDWIEDDEYLPKPGDFIYYDWNSTGTGIGNCTGWADHVGIVVQTLGPVMKIIEGNKEDDVSYRYLLINDPCIRGFATPDYFSISQT